MAVIVNRFILFCRTTFYPVCHCSKFFYLTKNIYCIRYQRANSRIDVKEMESDVEIPAIPLILRIP